MREESLDLILIIKSMGDIYGSDFGVEKKSLAHNIDKRSWLDLIVR